MYRLYDYLPSGNGYKVRLVLKQLQLPYELIEVDIKAARSRTPEFLAKNPNGRIPLLEVPARAICPRATPSSAFLAEGSDLIPDDAFERARMWQWMCFEQYHLEPNIGTVRFWLSSLGKTRAELGEKLIEKKKSGYAALDVLEEGLRERSIWSRSATRSPTSRCSPTRTSRTKAASTSRRTRTSAAGATASRAAATGRRSPSSVTRRYAWD